MSRKVTVAAIQTSYSADLRENITKTIGFIEAAAKQGAQIILPSELFQGPYFCTMQNDQWFSHAYPASSHPCVEAMRTVAKQLGVVIPVSIFERDGQEYYNSVVMLDHQGEALGIYRKTHIPDGPGYQEKYYFRPGNTGFKVWQTKFATIGVGICWDQWFPECARAMTLAGAELLFYPTAIGSEPYDRDLDTSCTWQRAMQGHAVSNAIPVVAANRVGLERANPPVEQSFYGSSFICNQRGDLIAELDKTEQGVICSSFDLDELEHYRAMWGFFRDRRSEYYHSLTRGD